jgi:hypothetical protein
LVCLEQFSKISLRFTSLKQQVRSHFPVIQITGKEIIKTGKRGSRIGKFISGKIYDDFENIVICLEGYYPQLAGI